MAALGSSPTPLTKELFLVVTKEAEGAPEAALAVAIAPMAPDPLTPEVSTPAKLMTVSDEVLLLFRVAVTVTPLSVAGAKARQISAVPLRTLVRTTSAQVSPAPDTPLTVAPEVSVLTKASSSSSADFVEKLPVSTSELGFF